MRDKVLITIITRNNPVLLQHLLESLKERSPGYNNDILILDGESTDLKQQKFLDKVCGNYMVKTVPNNRVEASYNIAWEENKDYKYYFFMHDDSKVVVDDWLKLFIDRMNSEYYEDIIKGTHLKHLPIGKVCIGTQPWRNYNSILGFSVQCVFLEHALKILRPNNVPPIFKYADCDRVMIRNECMNDTKGFKSVKDFRELKESDFETFDKICKVLNKYLPYPDEGVYKLKEYPPGECWNKLSLLGEFLNSIDPLIKGWRTVGLADDGYLEQVHGFDVPFQHDIITHYGSPNVREFLGKKFNTDKDTVRKHFNNKAMLVKCDKIIKEYFNK